jgi:hypothetical protein
MAQATGTYSTYDATGLREELSDVISRIDPEETPLFSMLPKQKLKSKNPEWQLDTLAAAASNAQIEGDEYSYSSPSATSRVKTYAQISWKTGIVAETLDVVDKAGREKELTYQRLKRGVELRRDIEYVMLINQASVAGNDTTARKTAGFPAWLTSNDSRGATGSDGGYNSGTGVVDAATNGTQRAFTKAILDTIHESAFKNGGDPTTLMLSPYLKTVFATFMSDANVAEFRYAAQKSGKNTIVATADIYLGHFGEIMVKANRQMATDATSARNALLIDPGYAAVGTLRPMATEYPAKTGDANKFVIKCEWAVIMKIEKAHGIAADLYGLTASS